MYIKIVCFAIVVNVVISATVKDELKAVYNSYGQPFYELPCIVIGGSCAKVGNCPKDSKVVSKGLCPVQQNDGIECCKPDPPNTTCKASGGECISSKDFQCPQYLTVRDATNCGEDEVCCVFVN